MTGHKPAEARPGRPARISREAIAAAALEIGLAEVTLAGIAARLGVDHSSLYRHAKGRDDILLAAADLAIAQLDWRTETGDWRLYLERLAESLWDLYERHPGLADVHRTLGDTPVSGIRAFAEAVRRLQEMGFALEDAVLVLDSVTDMTADAFSGWQALGRSGAQGTDAEGVTMAEKVQQAWMRAAAEDPDIAGPVQAMMGVVRGTPKRWWGRKLAMLLDGAAALHAGSGGPIEEVGSRHPSPGTGDPPERGASPK